MKIINLLPEEEQELLRSDLVYNQMRRFLLIVVLSLIIFGALGFAAQQYLLLRVKRTETSIVQKRALLETDDIKVLQQQVITLNRATQEIKNIRAQQYKWSEVLLEIARILPEDVEVNSMQIDRKEGNVVILGKAQDRDAVIAIWSEIKKSSLFYDVNFPLPNLEKPTDSSFTYTFSIYLDKIKHDAKN